LQAEDTGCPRWVKGHLEKPCWGLQLWSVADNIRILLSWVSTDSAVGEKIMLSLDRGPES
jgi:hypothetical protein